MNQPRCAFDDMPAPLVNAPEPPVCEVCGRLVAHCDADARGCGSTPAKEETWRDRPSQL